MTATVLMSGLAAGIGGVIQGAFGTYSADTSGNFSVDVRDAPTLLALGLAYLRSASESYATGAVAAAAVGAVHASGALTNSTLSIAAQPDVTRQVRGIVAAGTSAITAGNLAATYLANDGATQVDNISLVTAASGTLTFFLTKGVTHLTSAVVTGLTGGASPGVQLDTTATIALPVDPSSTGLVVAKEDVDGGDEAVGTLSTTTLAGIAPTTAPNGTHTYSFVYSYKAPLV